MLNNLVQQLRARSSTHMDQMLGLRSTQAPRLGCFAKEQKNLSGLSSVSRELHSQRRPPPHLTSINQPLALPAAKQSNQTGGVRH